MRVTGVEAINQATLHGHCGRCLRQINRIRNPWRLYQLLDYEITHRHRRRIIDQLTRRFEVNQ